MEIRKTYEIMNYHDIDHNDDTKWVRVDDVINWCEKMNISCESLMDRDDKLFWKGYQCALKDLIRVELSQSNNKELR